MSDDYWTEMRRHEREKRANRKLSSTVVIEGLLFEVILHTCHHRREYMQGTEESDSAFSERMSMERTKLCSKCLANEVKINK